MENINFRGIPTSLFLNGPKLGIVTDPQSVSDAIGVATFTGIATATFLDNNFDFDGGSIAFKWYFDGSQILDTSVDINSNAEIIGFSSATGTGSTITINGLTTDDSGKEIYFEADYVPSAYQTTPPVTAGTARSTGNAFNEPLQSGIATVTVKPIIEITSQPEDQVVGQTFAAEYSIAARTIPGNGSVNYQWQLNGNDLSDGTTTTTVNTSGTGQIEITNSVDSTTEVIDFSQISTYSNFNPGVTYTLKSNANITTSLLLFGAGGGGSDVRSIPGSKGGVSEGTFTFVKDQEYKLILGTQGDRVTAGRPGGGTGGGTAGRDGRGGGGGYTGLFLGSIAHANAIIMAGGGGGSTGDPGRGGAGGDEVGGAGSNGGRAGLGGSQTAGGEGKGSSGSGSALQGGNGVNAGAGGGGYYGGGGGQPSGTISDGAGGGGSGYIHPTLITDGRTFKRDDEYIGSSDNLVYPGGTSQPGEFRIELVSSSKEVTTTITGATTQNLSITTDNEASGVIRCKLTADGVQESPVFSKSVSYYVVAIRNVLNIEQYNYADATATLSEHDLSNGSLSISYDTHPGNAICLYAGEKDVEVEMDMYGGKGIGFDEPGGTGEQFTQYNGYEGGEGGYSKIRFTMKKDEEYILTGLFSGVNAPFLYRKGTLIAAVGEGGWGGHYGRGGNGGGVKTSGEDGQGRSSGLGGVRYLPGNLPSDSGTFGTRTSLDGDTPDGKASGNAGGKTIPCARGVYWRNQGKAPCEDLGTIKFRTPDGTEISNTGSISRGYKSGYNIIQTGGTRGGSDGGNGGNGVTGGEGGNSGGGGGGSGYHDGSITEVITQDGGSTGKARINIKLSTGNFFIDDKGRILILSTRDNTDPRNLTKTTGVVNYNDNACIDDARWQRFLDLARDGTQDYRLTATENNSTVKITNATEKNIHKMMNANQIPLRTSLTDWYDTNYSYELIVLAWDETSGATITGGDYSLLSWSPTNAYGYGFYGSSSVPFFNPTVYGYKGGVDFWILPPGVPDF
jgi:hypothetical protein